MAEQTQYAPPVGPTGPMGPMFPPGYRKGVRTHLRHPLENLCLVLVLLGSVLVWSFAGYEVASAIVERRQPDPYAVFFLAAPVIVYFARGQLYAQLRLSGVKISPTQYPQAHQMLVEAAAHHGLTKLPDAYVVLGNGMINAAASGHGFRKFIFVYSDLFEIGGEARNPDALRFIIGHEVGHIAAGHTSYWRLLGISGASWIPFLGSTLSRSQEYTADNFGYAMVPQGSAAAMATLAAGKYLNRTVDVNALADRATTETGFFVWWVNALASHPVLVWRSHALRDRRRPGRLLWRPKDRG
ncbi:M48 family metallopeptidase [Phycicoccus sp. 3266]|jgi:Zn-dependent protease with chaperone function|uniref:M48 family metallopeptidase n=1 Tax=Phycicoccus sp. 3266 TaxID=2817751 RepID=UPI0028563A36|nr:M48 family metallopeptidase [Phycicoccus sp. 3266]MDR6861701.1 Zn-dependent protease with chaperone function [Phycicoccus sp. 3266]